MGPAQPERGRPGMPGDQPAAQLHQQPPRAEEHRRRRLHARRQLQPRPEGLRQNEPLVGFRLQPIGTIESRQQRLVEAPADAAARQLPDIPQRAAAELRQGRQIRRSGARHLHRQRIQDVRQRLPEAAVHAGPRQHQRRQAVRRPGQAVAAQLGSLLHDAVAQAPLAPEQAYAGLQLDDDGLFEEGDAGAVLQRPRSRPLERVIGWRRGVGAGEPQGGPQHRRAPCSTAGRPTGERDVAAAASAPRPGRPEPRASSACRRRQAHGA